MTFLKKLTPFTLPFLLAACGDDNLDPNAINAPDVYEFASLTDPSAVSSVDYREATTRLVLIKELEYLIGSDYLQEYGTDVNNTKDDVISLLNRVYEGGTTLTYANNLIDVNLYNNTSTATSIRGMDLKSGLDQLQQDFSQLEPNTNLKSHMAGLNNNKLFMLNPIDKESIVFIGWGLPLTTDHNLIPDRLIQSWFESIATLAKDGNPDTKYSNGSLDFQALITVFLMGSINYYQATNIHLNANLGLLTDNTTTSDAPYTNLQHQWDLAMGYYGASQNIKLLTNQQVIEQPDHDYNKDNKIDFFSEYNFKFSINSAARNAGSLLSNVNLSEKIIQAFLNGRELIDKELIHGYTDTANPLSTQVKQLKEQWEHSIAATLLHYLNTTANDSALLKLSESDPDTANEYNRAHHATQWSMLKAYTLILQFNSNGKLSSQDFIDIHSAIGQNPELKSGGINSYIKELFTAQALITEKFGFSIQDAENW